MGVTQQSYFEWFEIGGPSSAGGIPYKEIEAQGFYLVVVEAFCRYRKPLRYDQRFTIRVTLREATAKKVVFDATNQALPDRLLVAPAIRSTSQQRPEARSVPCPIRSSSWITSE
jgi:acyl-CoA thioester hydrolase